MNLTAEKIDLIYRSLELGSKQSERDAIIQSCLTKEVIRMLPPHLAMTDLLDPEMPIMRFIISGILIGIRIGYQLRSAEELECLMNK